MQADVKVETLPNDVLKQIEYAVAAKMRENFPLKEYKPRKKHVKSTDRYRKKDDTTLMHESNTWSSNNLKIYTDDENADLKTSKKFKHLDKE